MKKLWSVEIGQSSGGRIVIVPHFCASSSHRPKRLKTPFMRTGHLLCDPFWQEHVMQWSIGFEGINLLSQNVEDNNKKQKQKTKTRNFGFCLQQFMLPWCVFFGYRKSLLSLVHWMNDPARVMRVSTAQLSVSVWSFWVIHTNTKCYQGAFNVTPV